MPLEDLEYIKQMAFGRLPIVQLVPVEKMSFPLYDWEAKRFMEWQKEVNIDGKIKPLRAILDLNTNKAIVVTYFMDSDACHFLKDKKCLIYNTNRAYICRLFPFNRGPFLETGEKPKKENMFGNCCGMKKLMPSMPEGYNEMVKFLSKAFPDGSFENSVEFDYIADWVNRAIIGLMKKKLIRPAINYPYNLFLKRFENSEKIDFMDFLAEAGYIDSKDELIKNFDENRDAKQKIDEFLQNDS